MSDGIDIRDNAFSPTGIKGIKSEHRRRRKVKNKIISNLKFIGH
jgi:hypothetical protein